MIARVLTGIVTIVLLGNTGNPPVPPETPSPELSLQDNRPIPVPPEIEERDLLGPAIPNLE